MTSSHPTMRRRAAALALSWLAAVTSVAACGPDETAVVPSECAEGGPFSEPACGRVLAAICGRYADRGACDDAPLWYLDRAVRCVWADVVTIADPTTCAVESVGGRCVATLLVGEGGPACIDACDEDPGGEAAGWAVSRRGDELVRVPDPEDGCWGGPIDETIAIEVPPEDKTYGSCGANLTPPAPDLCACGPAACAALR